MNRLGFALACLLFASSALVAQSVDSTTSSRDDSAQVQAVYTYPPPVVMHSVQRVHRDSLLRHNYHHVGDAITLANGISLYTLGVPGAPSWFSFQGSGPDHQRISRNGVQIQDPMTFVPRLEMVAFEDASEIYIYPQHQAFWYGGTGTLAAVNVIAPVRNTPHPETRLRHMFGPYEYLYTDVDFSLNTSESSNFTAGLTRQTYGTNNGGRYQNTNNERWNARLEYSGSFGEQFAFRVVELYNDHFTRLNGGIVGTFTADSGAIVYPAPDDNGFKNSAFSTFDANPFNSTILVKEFSNNLYAEGSYNWFKKTSMTTSARIGFQNGWRNYEDNGYSRNDSLNSINNRLQVERRWSNIYLDGTHSVDIGWAELELAGSVGGWQFRDDSSYYSEKETMTSMGKAMLRFRFDAFRLQLMARLENTYWQYTYGVGATIETNPTEASSLWAGVSTGTKPYSLFETRFNSPRALSATGSDPDYEQSMVLEGGITYDYSGIHSAVTAFFRRTTEEMLLTGHVYQGDMMYARMASDRTLTHTAFEYTGLSLSLSAAWWLFGGDVKGTLVFQTDDNSNYSINTLPKWQGAGSFYLRSNKNIVETLDLKAGARCEYSSAYTPYVYLPESGAYAIPHLQSLAGSEIAQYTEYVRVDLFLYANIRDIATLHVVLYNLLDTQYISTQFYPMPERGLQFGVDWKFLD